MRRAAGRLRRALRTWPARINLINAGALQGWLQLPDELRAHLPPPVMILIASVLATLSMLAHALGEAPAAEPAAP